GRKNDLEVSERPILDHDRFVGVAVVESAHQPKATRVEREVQPLRDFPYAVRRCSSSGATGVQCPSVCWGLRPYTSRYCAANREVLLNPHRRAICVIDLSGPALWRS